MRMKSAHPSGDAERTTTKMPLLDNRIAKQARISNAILYKWIVWLLWPLHKAQFFIDPYHDCMDSIDSKFSREVWYFEPFDILSINSGRKKTCKSPKINTRTQKQTNMLRPIILVNWTSHLQVLRAHGSTCATRKYINTWIHGLTMHE